MLDRITDTRGHTLTELLVMFGIVAVISSSTVPVFSNLLLDSRMNATITTALHAVNVARQFSAARSESIRLCGSEDQHECSGRVDWSSGLLLTADNDGLRRSLPLTGGARAPRIRSNRATVSFEGGSGFASPATLTVCDRRGTRAARAVIISRTGRPRISSRDGSDRPLAC
ncbi:MAG: GspH/FimT family pseudopilin [Steroidobacteraceae bacterium]